jgi:hypothetical protein
MGVAVSILLHRARTDGTKISSDGFARIKKHERGERRSAHQFFFGGQAGAGGEKLYPRRQLK